MKKVTFTMVPGSKAALLTIEEVNYKPSAPDMMPFMWSAVAQHASNFRVCHKTDVLICDAELDDETLGKVLKMATKVEA